MRTLTISRQIVTDKESYSKSRLQIPLPKATQVNKYRVLLDDRAESGLLYGTGVPPWKLQTVMVQISPIGASLAASLDILGTAHIDPAYISICGSAAMGDYLAPLSDVDLLIVVADKDVKKARAHLSQLRPEIDPVVVGLSDIHRLGSGVDNLVLANSKPVLDKIGLSEIIKHQTINWVSVKSILLAEMGMLSSYKEIVELSNTKRDRNHCTTHILARLRGVFLADCLMQNAAPVRSRLMRILKNYGISESVLRKLYTIARSCEKGLIHERDSTIDKRTLLSICEAIVKYGEEVSQRIGKRAA